MGSLVKNVIIGKIRVSKNSLEGFRLRRRHRPGVGMESLHLLFQSTSINPPSASCRCNPSRPRQGRAVPISATTRLSSPIIIAIRARSHDWCPAESKAMIFNVRCLPQMAKWDGVAIVSQRLGLRAGVRVRFTRGMDRPPSADMDAGVAPICM